MHLSLIAPDVGLTCDGVVSEKEGCAGERGAGERGSSEMGAAAHTEGMVGRALAARAGGIGHDSL